MKNIDDLLPEKNSIIARDLRLNLKRILEESELSKEEGALALLAVSSSEEFKDLIDYSRKLLSECPEITPEMVQEAAESAAIMGMLNMYYRFRHMIQSGQGDDVYSLYNTAGLRMTSLAKPKLGKERFEMLAFAISILNGCESCINAHEKMLREMATDSKKIHDLARMAATVKGLKTLSALQAEPV